MQYSYARLVTLGLVTLTLCIFGQTGSCGVVPSNGGQDAGGPDPLAPLVEAPDPLAPLVPGPARGVCGLWAGKLTGTRHRVQIKHYECPWQGGGSSITHESEDELHQSSYDVKFRDIWAADTSRCAPSGAGSKALSTMGTVQYKRSWSERYDYGDACGRYHQDMEDETFAFSVKPQDVHMSIAVYAPTYTQEQSILAERPCRPEYPVRVQIQVSAPAAGGAGTFTAKTISKPCSLPETTSVTDQHATTENFAASYLAILYGTYRLAADGSDTIEAKCSIPLPANPTAQTCSGVNSNCPSQCSETVAEEYTLSLTRLPEGDRDMDGECDSVDPCPDQAFENECE